MFAVPRDAHEAVVEHALEGAPAEVCGVHGGMFDERSLRVVVAERATDIAPSPVFQYAIDPAEQLELMDGLEAGGHDVVGFYHSHPTVPRVQSGRTRNSQPG